MDDLSAIRATLNMLHAHARQSMQTLSTQTLIQIEAIDSAHRILGDALDRLAAAEGQREALDVGLLTTALHTADPIIGPDGVGHTPMCETRAALIAAAYERERVALKEQPR